LFNLENKINNTIKLKTYFFKLKLEKKLKKIYFKKINLRKK